MNVYEEYPIRCKTCNEQIACFISDYKELLRNGSTPEEALNSIGITNYCSRIAILSPTYVAYNMENRAVIEGKVRVENIMDWKEPETPELVPNISLTGCIQPEKTREKPDLPREKKPSSIRLVTSRKQTSRKGKDLAVEAVDVSTKKEDSISVVTDNDLEFKYPTIPGIPVINKNPTVEEEKVYVGDKKYVKISSGRTYLAR